MGTGRIRRAVGPARLAARGAARWLRASLARPQHRPARRERAMLETADDVTRTLGEMKGAAMKFGQVLSMMTGAVPPEMAGRLSTLHQQAPPMAYPLVERVFRQEFGRPPDQLFDRFEREPFAAASIGQVHRASLAGYPELAVKVQYPGVADAIDHDLGNAALLFRMASPVARGLDMATVTRDLAEGIRGELDYEREARTQADFAERFAGHAFVRVPRVFAEHSTARVLTQEYLPGRPLSAALEMSQADRDRIGEIIYRFAFGSIYRHGLFNGDPHPGNYVLLDGGGVGFLDYGQVSAFMPETVEGFARIIRALLAKDLAAWRRGCEELGILLRGAPYATEELYDHMRWFWAPILEEEVRFTPELAAEMVRRNAMTRGEGGAINQWCAIPEGMVFLTRINFGLAGVLASLGASGPWQGIVAEYVLGEPPCTALGRRSEATSRGPGV